MPSDDDIKTFSQLNFDISALLPKVMDLFDSFEDKSYDEMTSSIKSLLKAEKFLFKKTMPVIRKALTGLLVRIPTFKELILFLMHAFMPIHLYCIFTNFDNLNYTGS